MKDRTRILNRLNVLLELNYETEKVFSEASEIVTEKALSCFFITKSIQRQEFIELLKLEILKLKETPKNSNDFNSVFYEKWVDFKALISEKDEEKLLSEISKIKMLTVYKYDEVLQEPSLPLSACRVLMKHRDDIQNTVNKIIRNEILV